MKIIIYRLIMRRWNNFSFFHNLLTSTLQITLLWGGFYFFCTPPARVLPLKKQIKTASPAAFDGPCPGASRLITGTVAGSLGLKFFSQNLKNRSITIKILEHENGGAPQKPSQSEKDHSLDEKSPEEKKQAFAGEWVGRTYCPAGTVSSLAKHQKNTIAGSRSHIFVQQTVQRPRAGKSGGMQLSPVKHVTISIRCSV